MHGTLPLFILISCIVPQQLVRGEDESSLSRQSLYFDSYNQEVLDDDSLDDDPSDDLREAVLLQPEEVIDIAPNSFDRADTTPCSHSTEEQHSDEQYDVLDDGVEFRQPLHFVQNIVENIQSTIQNLFGKQQHESFAREIRFKIDPMFDFGHADMIITRLIGIGAKVCATTRETRDRHHVYFKPLRGCLNTFNGKEIGIGVYCFNLDNIDSFVLTAIGRCDFLNSTYRPPTGHKYSDRGSLIFANHNDPTCVDSSSLCSKWIGNDSCSPFSSVVWEDCPKTCHLCGENCVDYGHHCPKTDPAKECLESWSTMKLYCAKTCGICSTARATCDDRLSTKRCESKKRRGYCTRFPEYMEYVCAKTCGFCKSLCVDERKDCAALKQDGACTKMPGLMQQHCRKTCNLCYSSLPKNNELDCNTGDCLSRSNVRHCVPDFAYIYNKCIINPRN